jgi:WD40 repeat protein
MAKAVRIISMTGLILVSQLVGRLGLKAASKPTAVQEEVREIRQAPHLLHAHHGEIKRLVFSPGGKWLASTATDGAVQIRDMSTNHLVQTLRVEASSVLFTPDGRLLATGSGYSLLDTKNRSVRLWSIRTGRMARRLTADRHFVSVHDWSAPCRALAVDENNGAISIWSTTTWKPIRTLRPPLDPNAARKDMAIHSVRFSPDGK